MTNRPDCWNLDPLGLGIRWVLDIGNWSLLLKVSPVVRFHLAVSEAEEVEQTVEDEAAEFRGVGDTVLASLGTCPVAGDVDFTEQAWFTRELRLVAVKRDDVGRAVALQEPTIQLVYPSVGHEYHVDGGSLREKSRDILLFVVGCRIWPETSDSAQTVDRSRSR